MTDPAGGAPTPPPPEPTPATPPPAAAAPPPSSWQTPPPQAQAGGFQMSPAAAGPAPGVAYAETTMRVVAYIIDIIILWIAIALVAIILGSIAFGVVVGGGFAIGVIIAVVIAIIALLGSAFYFVYFWQALRASPGQKMIGLETVNAADGATLTRDQAVRRWAFLYGPTTVAGVFQFAGVDVVDARFARVAARAARVPVRDLPAVHRDPEPEAPGLPRRPGVDGGRQAPLIRDQPSSFDGVGHAGPVSIQGSKSRLLT